MTILWGPERSAEPTGLFVAGRPLRRITNQLSASCMLCNFGLNMGSLMPPNLRYRKSLERSGVVVAKSLLTWISEDAAS